MNRVSFTKAFFEHLGTTQTEYVLLKHVSPTLDAHDVHSDLDILLPNGMGQGIFNFIEKYGDVEFVRWQSWADRTAAFIFFKDGDFLQLDFLKHLERKSWIYLPNRIVLANKKYNEEGIIVCNERCIMEHAILFNFLNHSGLSKKYLDFFHSLPEKEQHNLTEQINFKYGLELKSLDDLARFDGKLLKIFKRYIGVQPENNYLIRQKRYIAYVANTVKNIFGYSSPVITFSGVDGAGKSTLLEALRTRLENDYRQDVVVLRHRPGLLPILSVWTKGKEKAEKEAAATLPHSGNNKSSFGASLRFLYYFVDYLIGQLWVWARYQCRGKVVLYDRYYFDFMADPRRSNVAQLPKWLTKFCFHFIKQPDLNVFLYTDKDTILSRKKELAPETITQLTGSYRTLFDQLGHQNPDAYLQLENIELNRSLDVLLGRFRSLMRH